MIRLTPVTPQWRLVQAGTVNLDGVVHFWAQIKNEPGLSRCRNHL